MGAIIYTLTRNVRKSAIGQKPAVLRGLSTLSEEKGIAVLCMPTRGCMTQRHLLWACLGDKDVVEYKMHDWTPLTLAIRITFISIAFALRGSSGVVGRKSKKAKNR